MNDFFHQLQLLQRLQLAQSSQLSLTYLVRSQVQLRLMSLPHPPQFPQLHLLSLSRRRRLPLRFITRLRLRQMVRILLAVEGLPPEVLPVRQVVPPRVGFPFPARTAFLPAAACSPAHLPQLLVHLFVDVSVFERQFFN